MEIIILTATLHNMEGHNLLSREQHSFRKGLSCLTNLLIVEDRTDANDKNILVDVIETGKFRDPL